MDSLIYNNETETFVTSYLWILLCKVTINYRLDCRCNSWHIWLFDLSDQNKICLSRIAYDTLFLFGQNKRNRASKLKSSVLVRIYVSDIYSVILQHSSNMVLLISVVTYRIHMLSIGVIQCIFRYNPSKNRYRDFMYMRIHLSESNSVLYCSEADLLSTS